MADLFAPLGLVRRLLAMLTEREGEPGPPARPVLLDPGPALPEPRSDGDLEPVLHAVVQAALAATGASAAVVLVDGDGHLERFAAAGADGCTRDTLVRPALLAGLTRQLRARGRPIVAADLEEDLAPTVAAIAPRGFLAVPIDARISGILMLMDPPDGDGLLAAALAIATALARLAGTAVEHVRRVRTLHESCEELRRFAGRVVAARDDERRRTARALHEGIGQHLAAANAHLQALAPFVETALPRDRLHDARTLIEETLREMRELAQELRPSVLDDFGYVQALRWYVERLQERAKVRLSLEVEGPETRLPEEMESALYRATEEALGAVLRRDGSEPLRLRYRRERNAVRLEIGGRAPERLSLIAIRERLRPFGGAVRVSREPETFTLEVPTRPS